MKKCFRATYMVYGTRNIDIDNSWWAQSMNALTELYDVAPENVSDLLQGEYLLHLDEGYTINPEKVEEIFND